MQRRAEKVEEILSRAHQQASEVFDSARVLQEQIYNSEVQIKTSIDQTFQALAELLDRQRRAVVANFEAAIAREVDCLDSQVSRLKLDEAELNLEFQSLRSLQAELLAVDDLKLTGRDYLSILNQKKQAALDLVTAFNCKLSSNCPTISLDSSLVKKAIVDFGLKQFIKDPVIAFFGDKNKVMLFDLTKKTWEARRCVMPYEFNYYAAAVTLPDGSALITGGGSSNAVYKFNNFKLELCTPMKQARKEHAAVCLGEFVYVMGGYDGLTNRFLRSCERFSLAEGTWRDMQNLNMARCAFSATVVNDLYIYIFGGYDGAQRLASIERYVPLEDAWQALRVTLRFPLSNCACFATRSSQLVVLGGGFSSGFSMAVELLDLDREVWQSLPMMTEGRDLRNKVVVYDNRVYCVGGYNFKAEAFDLSSQEWVQLPNYLVSDNLDSWSCALLHSVMPKP
jgi:hypothetical protein